MSRTTSVVPVVALAAAIVAFCASPASPQTPCGEWDAGLFPADGLTGDLNALTIFDDGMGTALYAAGGFREAGGVVAERVARFDGKVWSPLGTGFDDEAHSFGIFDDGSGPALFVGGDFLEAGGIAAPFVARWDGSAWSDVGGGMNGRVRALLAFDDGTGPALYAGGAFTMAGGVPAAHVARFKNGAWEAIGSGTNDRVTSLAIFDDGSGPALFAGGDFSLAGGVPAQRVARWDGTAWTAPGSTGINAVVQSLAVFDDGSGPALFAAGEFSQAGGGPSGRVVRYDGVAWTAMPGAPDGGVQTLWVHDDGGGAALYAGGRFFNAGGQPSSFIARWDGTSWSPLGAGRESIVNALATFDDGGGPALFVGGSQSAYGTPFIRSAALERWRSGIWTSVSAGLDGPVRDFAIFDDGNGSAMYACGYLTRVGGEALNFVARRTGDTWSALGAGLDRPALTLAVHDDGAGPALFVGGLLQSAGGAPASHIARWDGAAWSPLGAGTSSTVSALASFDDGSGAALFVGGSFEMAGGLPADAIARWDGANWSPLAIPFDDVSPSAARVESMAVFDDGSGPSLFVGGNFSSAGGVTLNSILEWDGATFAPLSTGVSGTVSAMAVFDDGSGPALYVGGSFPSAGSATVNHVARWDGVAWSAVGAGFDGSVSDLVVWDDGNQGPALYAAGFFTASGGVATRRIARFDGNSWVEVGSGVERGAQEHAIVRALQPFDDGHGPALFAGGDFNRAGGDVSGYAARWSVAARDCRAGSVNTAGGAPPADVLFVNGSAGDPICRRVQVAGGEPSTIEVRLPPAGGRGHYVVWLLEHAPRADETGGVRYMTNSGIVYELGDSCRPLPSNNLVTPGSVACPATFRRGWTSLSLSLAKAATLCVNPRPGFPRAPTSFVARFPFGVFSLAGFIVDPGSPNVKPVSVANWVVVESR